MSYTVRKRLSGTTFRLLIAYLYLEPLKSNGALNFTIRQNSPQKFKNVFATRPSQRIWNYFADAPVGYRSVPHILKALFTSKICLADSIMPCLYIERNAFIL